MPLLTLPRRVRLLSRLAALSGLGLAGCSLLQNVSSVQCSQTSDCERLGTAFEGTVCQRSFCVSPNSGSGGGNGLGGGGNGECTSNGECIDAPDNFGEPAACIEGACVPLKTTEECPWVLGLGEDNINLRKPEPIIIGAYAPIEAAVPTGNAHMLNYEFAIDEMNGATGGGLPGGPGGSSRPFVAVVCRATDEPDLEASMSHLIEDLRVPAIISALNAPDLKETFNTMGLPHDVFFMSPIDADTTLTSIQDDGLLWHMLPEGRDLAPGYVAMVHAVEAWVRQERGLEPTEPLKLALVDARSQFLLDISARLMTEMTFNGESVGTNRDNNLFLRLQTDSAAEVNQPDISMAEDALFAFEPDIVVSVGADESLTLIKNLDQGWAPALGPKPFYIVSPWVFGLSALVDPAFGDVPERLMGVNFAGAEDPTLYKDFLDAIEARYYGVEQLGGKENFYDAAYYLMYAIAAAGDQGQLRGSHIKAGLERLINPSASTQRFNVGRDAIPDALAYLTLSTAKIGLVGTMGEPVFNQTGARAGLPSYFCVDQDQGRERIQDALRYDPDTMTVTGSQSCVTDFPVPPP